MSRLPHKVWRHAMWRQETKYDSLAGFLLNIFECQKKVSFFIISPRAQLTYKIYPIKLYREWPNLNTVKISFCKVAVPLVKFAIKDLKATENVKTRLPYPYLAPYNTREEGQHRRISADPKIRNVQHTKKPFDTFIHWLIFSRFTRFGWFVNLLLYIKVKNDCFH